MPDCEAHIDLDKKYSELLRSFKSLNTKVNNNNERYAERFTKVEKFMSNLETPKDLEHKHNELLCVLKLDMENVHKNEEKTYDRFTKVERQLGKVKE